MILVQSSSNVEDAWSVDASAGGWDVVNNAGMTWARNDKCAKHLQASNSWQKCLEIHWKRVTFDENLMTFRRNQELWTCHP